MGAKENLVKNENLLVLSYCNEEVKTWTNATGQAVYDNKDGTKRRVKYGKVGSADRIGLTSKGKFIAIEDKTFEPGSKQREKQIAFEKMVLGMGGIYFVSRCWMDCLSNLLMFGVITPEKYNFILRDIKEEKRVKPETKPLF